MKHIKKIAIIGNSGSGKSTLAKKLHNILDLPIYHLDQYFWKPNWTRPDLTEYKIIHDNLCDKNKWIIDGMNLNFLEYRIQKTEVVIFLDIPRYVCFINIFKRIIKYYGKRAPSSAKECKEGKNPEFMKFLKWVWNFKTTYPPKIMKLLKDYAGNKEIYILRSKKDIDLFLDNCQP